MGAKDVSGRKLLTLLNSFGDMPNFYCAHLVKHTAKLKPSLRINCLKHDSDKGVDYRGALGNISTETWVFKEYLNL